MRSSMLKKSSHGALSDSLESGNPYGVHVQSIGRRSCPAGDGVLIYIEDDPDSRSSWLRKAYQAQLSVCLRAAPVCAGVTNRDGLVGRRPGNGSIITYGDGTDDPASRRHHSGPSDLLHRASSAHLRLPEQASFS